MNHLSFCGETVAKATVVAVAVDAAGVERVRRSPRPASPEAPGSREVREDHSHRLPPESDVVELLVREVMHRPGSSRTRPCRRRIKRCFFLGRAERPLVAVHPLVEATGPAGRELVERLRWPCPCSLTASVTALPDWRRRRPVAFGAPSPGSCARSLSQVARASRGTSAGAGWTSLRAREGLRVVEGRHRAEDRLVLGSIYAREAARRRTGGTSSSRREIRWGPNTWS